MQNKQAILIMAHNNVNILKQILKLLDSKYFDIYIHIDKKSYIEKEELENICEISNIYIYKEIDVKWADFSQVQCELFLLNKAVKHDYMYYHLISGVDMPIKTAKEIHNFFANLYPMEFVHFESKNLSKEKIEWLKYYHWFIGYSRNNNFFKVLEKLGIIIQKIIGINRIKNKNIRYLTGANWFSITNDFAHYLIENELKIKKDFSYTRSPDEVFVQTLLYNSSYIENLFYNGFDNNYDACMRMIDWERGLPYVFTSEDYDLLIESKYMFARKFDEKVDNMIINKIYDTLATKE